MQNAADFLYKKRPVYFTESSWFIAQRVPTFLLKKGPLSWTKTSSVIAQDVAAFLNRNHPLACAIVATEPPSWLCWSFLFINCTHENLTVICWLSMGVELLFLYYENEQMCIGQFVTRYGEL